ncbi:OLC1v1024290C1 [Oldenlandia corymbosa var. corymbosa]|uniref:Transcription elongation factor n=1 Tax=Oldenlandia corymbosa var. corymbosa TaxID=529605 RepID=A0AAV1C5G6_OLDCO|nr:OLC1v1024290C1 [Oldenlandia corymbosa var. corymbosa]
MDKEVVALFERAKKAADAAAAGEVGVDSSGAENLCMDALKRLKGFPINYDILASTQVGKRLRQLTKHPRKKIQSLSSDVLELWKATIAKQTVHNKNQGSLSLKRKRPSGDSDEDSGKEKKVQSVKSIKLADDSDKKTNSSGHVRVKLIKMEDKFYSGTKKPDLFSSVAPPKLTSLPSTKVKNRDKIRELLAEGLSKVAGEVSDDDDGLKVEVDSYDPLRVATEVESALFSKWGLFNGPKKAGYRSVMFNIKDPKNRDFRRKVLLGRFPPTCIADLSPEEMASDERRKQNEEIKEKALFNSERGAPEKATNGAFQCGKCKKRETTYYQLQTRSADEPMTTFVTCTNCNNRWRC